MRKVYSLKDTPHLWTDGINVFTSRPTVPHDLLDPYGVATFDDRRPEDRERSRKISKISDGEDISAIDNAWAMHISDAVGSSSDLPEDVYTRARAEVKPTVKRPEVIDTDAIDGVPESEMVEL